jgi:hypothetical protein
VRARDAVVREWEEDRLRMEHEHKQHMHQTIQSNELLQAETRARADQLASARKENDCTRRAPCAVAGGWRNRRHLSLRYVLCPLLC